VGGATADRAIALAHGRLVARANFTAFGYWEGLISHWKSFGLAIFTAVSLLAGPTGSAHANNVATEWSGGSIINLEGLPGSTDSVAYAINDAGQAVGNSTIGVTFATEWSGGSVVNLGGLSGSYASSANGINGAGQVAGFSFLFGGTIRATEWGGGVGGSIINLGGLPGSTSSGASSINNTGQVVGYSLVDGMHYQAGRSSGLHV
jgi:uncharacterized membrane protein